VVSRRTWPAARRYALPPLAAGLAMAAARSRAAGIPLAAGLGVLWFFRDPDRPLPARPGIAWAAGDGVVTAVDRIAVPWLDCQDCLRVSTFLSVANVHVARSPVAGTLERWDDAPGPLHPALSRRAHRNRQARLVIRPAPGEAVGVTLIAGAIARRITAWAGPGDGLGAGQRIGLIHFGSRIDILLPAGRYAAAVQPGDRTAAGQTPLARALAATPGDC
jgi:phosphatidylserine decarboxylase